MTDFDSVAIKFAVTDIDGVLRGKIVNRKNFLKAMKEGVGFCSVIFGWDMNDLFYDNSLQIADGVQAMPIQRRSIDINAVFIPWDDGIPFFIADFGEVRRNWRLPVPDSFEKGKESGQLTWIIPNFAKEFGGSISKKLPGH